MKLGSMSSSIAPWQGFWRLMLESGKFESPSVIPEAARFFAKALSADYREDKLVLELASGNGALERALRLHSKQMGVWISLDYSWEALKMSAVMNQSQGVQATLEAMPLAEGACDAVVSQFGFEYAKENVLDSICSIIKPRGRLCMLMHKVDSIIYRDFEATCRQLGEAVQSEFFERLIHVLNGWDDAPLSSQLISLSDLAALSQQLDVGEEKSVSLGADFLSYIQINLKKMVSAEGVENLSAEGAWLKSIAIEWGGFLARAQAMVDAALTRNDFLAVQESLMDNGFSIQTAAELKNGSKDSLGYALCADKNIS
jgi:SAM-dependent methyltransferase